MIQDASSQIVDHEAGGAVKLPLLAQVSCPHCWHQFPPEDTLWISSDAAALRGDPKLPDQPRRFAAERFDVQGHGLDARGQRAQGLACPNCHLEVPRAFFEYSPYFISIVGGPGSGKSFFLPAMTWALRSLLPAKLGLNFQDADPKLNLRLHDYEKSLFLSSERDSLVTLEKTQVQGMKNLYDEVIFSPGELGVSLPRPFVFRLEPRDPNLSPDRIAAGSRAVCLYDNAGEAFLAASEAENSRLTNHLEHCEATFFLFDPTKHPRFREAAAAKSQDPQMHKPLSNDEVFLQNTILDNAANRLRKLRGLALRERFSGPLIVVVTKLDAWVQMLPNAREVVVQRDYLQAVGKDGSATVALRTDHVHTLSQVTRTLLSSLAPEVVAAAEAFSTDVTYVPCSATGTNVRPLGGDAYGVRPRDIKPKLCELPLLTALAKASPPLIRTAARKTAPAAESVMKREAPPPGQV